MARWAEWERGPSEQKHKSDRVRVRSSCCTSAWSQGQPAAAMLSTKATQLLIAALLKVTIQAQKLCRAAPATAVRCQECTPDSTLLWPVCRPQPTQHLVHGLYHRVSPAVLLLCQTHCQFSVLLCQATEATSFSSCSR